MNKIRNWSDVLLILLTYGKSVVGILVFFLHLESQCGREEINLGPQGKKLLL